MVDKNFTDLSEASLECTGEPLNFAIDGDGFFVVETPQGEALTRSGNFHLDSEGCLVTSDGLPVLSDNGHIKTVHGKLTIDIHGVIRTDGDEFGRLRLVDFERPYHLQRLSAETFRPLPDSDQVEPEFAYVRQGYLEKSNAEVIKEIDEMIASYGNYESDEDAIQILESTVDGAVEPVGRFK